MRKSLCSVLLLLLLTGLVAAQEIQVKVDGEPVSFSPQEPIIENQRVLVPLRGVFEKMGAVVQWNPQDSSIAARRGSDEVRLAIGRDTATVNGVTHDLDTAPMLRQGRTLVPLRFISESLRAQVQWKSEDKTVLVSSSGGDNLNPVATRTGIVKKAQPGITMQGTHQLEDESGELMVLLSDRESDADLDQYLDQMVTVKGDSEATVEGNMTLIRVESVRKTR